MRLALRWFEHQWETTPKQSAATHLKQLVLT